VAEVEGQPLRVLAFQPRRHEHQVRIDREVDERALLEPEEGQARVAVGLVLALGVADRLPRHGVLQLQGGDGDAVDGQHDVDALLRVGVEPDLPGEGEDVLGVGGNRVRVHAACGLEGGHLEGLAEALEAVAQHVERAFRRQLLHERVDEHALGGVTLQVGERLPLLGLGGLDVGHDIGGEEPRLGGIGFGLAPLVAARGKFDLDRVLEPGLGMLAPAAHSAASLRSPAPRTSILPVTADVMRAERYSSSNSSNRRFVAISASTRVVSRSRKDAIVA
jgi:hypothetical protein